VLRDAVRGRRTRLRPLGSVPYGPFFHFATMHSHSVPRKTTDSCGIIGMRSNALTIRSYPLRPGACRSGGCAHVRALHTKGNSGPRMPDSGMIPLGLPHLKRRRDQAHHCCGSGSPAHFPRPRRAPHRLAFHWPSVLHHQVVFEHPHPPVARLIHSAGILETVHRRAM
jgi:hypothetical protein